MSLLASVLFSLALVVLLLIIIRSLFAFYAHIRAENKEKSADTSAKSNFVARPPRKPSGIDHKSLTTFDNVTYETLLIHYTAKMQLNPHLQPVEFYNLSCDLLLKYINLCVNVSHDKLRDSYIFSRDIDTKVSGVDLAAWEQILTYYQSVITQQPTSLSDYVYYLSKAYSAIFLKKVLFKDFAIFAGNSKYINALEVIKRECQSSNVHNIAYGSSLVRYYTIHLQVIVHILENQRAIALGEGGNDHYLKYLEDELGLTKFDPYKETRNFIVPPLTYLDTEIPASVLAKGALVNV